jgi:hypothetical protein
LLLSTQALRVPDKEPFNQLHPGPGSPAEVEDVEPFPPPNFTNAVLNQQGIFGAAGMESAMFCKKIRTVIGRSVEG